MAFRVAQKVVYVGPNIGFNAWGVTTPINGAIYTGRNFEDRGTLPALRVEEIINPEMMHSSGLVTEPAFACRNFRPIVSTSTGMAVLEQIRRDVTSRELRPIWEDE